MNLYELCVQYLRRPASWAFTTGTAPVATFVPPLSPAEQTIFDDLVAMSQAFVLTLTLAEWQTIKADVAGLVTYAGLPTPTLAQTILAVKAQSRILKAILRS